ncbi:hypothetical protein U1Q18_035241 [Sarracenia purpurea var. burkii]
MGPTRLFHVHACSMLFSSVNNVFFVAIKMCSYYLFIFKTHSTAFKLILLNRCTHGSNCVKNILDLDLTLAVYFKFILRNFLLNGSWMAHGSVISPPLIHTSFCEFWVDLG